MIGSLKGNVLVLYQFVEKHGQPLYVALSQAYPNRPLHFVSGDVESDVREQIRAFMDGECVDLTFGPHKFTCLPDAKVTLTAGQIKEAKDISNEDDVCDNWIAKYATLDVNSDGILYTTGVNNELTTTVG